MDASTVSSSTSAFERRKAKIIEQLAIPDEQYTDLSPKGTVDVQIRWLVDGINKQGGFVTTSSCAGRVSVFLEGKRKLSCMSAGEDTEQSVIHEASKENLAGTGGKGAGGKWLHVSHDPIPVPAGGSFQRDEHFMKLFELSGETDSPLNSCSEEMRYVHFKFEPMILHIITSSPSCAQAALKAALQAGFRESGAINIGPSRATESTDGTSTTPMVAVRSTGLAMDSVIGFLGEDGTAYSLVGERYLRNIVQIANQRFKENTRRIEKFAGGLGILKDQSSNISLINALPEKVWEDVDTRRARKREEGLKTRQALKEAPVNENVANGEVCETFRNLIELEKPAPLS